MTQPVDAHMREAVLRYGSAITGDKTSAVAIVINSGCLLGWLEDAADPEDLDARFAAMRQHFHNLDATDDGPAVDDPARFLAGVKPLYAFLASPSDRLDVDAADPLERHDS